jgi:hypothetical protein
MGCHDRFQAGRKLVESAEGSKMARTSRMSVLKRKRESEKAEKSARKREMRAMEKESGRDKDKEPHSGEATQADLEAYGLVGPSSDDDDDS